MQGISIVAVTDELVGYFLCLATRTAEDDPIDVWVVVCDALEGEVLMSCRDDIVIVADVLVAFVLCPDDDLLRLVHVGGCDGADLTGHSRREEQEVSLFGYFGKDGL